MSLSDILEMAFADSLRLRPSDLRWPARLDSLSASLTAPETVRTAIRKAEAKENRRAFIENVKIAKMNIAREVYLRNLKNILAPFFSSLLNLSFFTSERNSSVSILCFPFPFFLYKIITFSENFSRKKKAFCPLNYNRKINMP